MASLADTRRSTDPTRLCGSTSYSLHPHDGRARPGHRRPWSKNPLTPSGAYVARPTPVKCVTHAETPRWGGGEVRRKAPVSAIDRVCGTTAGAVVPQPYPWGPAKRQRKSVAMSKECCARLASKASQPHTKVPGRGGRLCTRIVNKTLNFRTIVSGVSTARPARPLAD